MASSMRRAAQENNVNADIHAVSDSEIPGIYGQSRCDYAWASHQIFRRRIKKLKQQLMVYQLHVFLKKRTAYLMVKER